MQFVRFSAQEALEANSEDNSEMKVREQQSKKSSKHRKQLHLLVNELDAKRDLYVKRWEEDMLYEKYHN